MNRYSTFPKTMQIVYTIAPANWALHHWISPYIHNSCIFIGDRNKNLKPHIHSYITNGQLHTRHVKHCILFALGKYKLLQFIGREQPHPFPDKE